MQSNIHLVQDQKHDLAENHLTLLGRYLSDRVLTSHHRHFNVPYSREKTRISEILFDWRRG
jgi:hypothetical protein